MVITLCLSEYRLWKQCITSWWRQCCSGISQRLCYGIITLSCVTSVSVLVLLPTYYSFKNFYACGFPLSQLSVAYLDGYCGEWIMAATFVVYVIAILACVAEHLRQASKLQSEKSSMNMVMDEAVVPLLRPSLWTRLIGIMVIYAVCLFCAIPSVIYVMANSLPEDSIIPIHSAGTMFGILLPPFMLLCNQIIFPRVCYWSGNYDYPENKLRAIHVGLRRYRMLCTFFSTVLPFAVLAFWDGGCFRGFMKIWTPCTNGTFNIRNPPNIMVIDEFLLTTESVCNDLFRWGFCARRIVEVWGPVMMQKFLIVSILGFYNVIINSPMLHGLARRIESIVPIDILMTNSYFDIARRDAILVSHIELVIIWGMLSPLVGLAGFTAWITRTVTFYYLKEAGHCILNSHESVYWYILIYPVLVSLIQSWIFFENSFAGKELVWVVSCLVLIVSSLCLWWLWQNRSLTLLNEEQICEHRNNKSEVEIQPYVLMDDSVSG